MAAGQDYDRGGMQLPVVVEKALAAYFTAANVSTAAYLFLTISNANTPQVQVTVNSPCRAAWIPGIVPCRGEGVAHIILEVTDEGSPRLTSYRRVILHIRALATAQDPARK